MAIQTSLSTIERISVPSYLKSDTYLLKVQVIKEDEVMGEASETFFVEKPAPSKVITYTLSQKSLYIMLALLVVFMVIFITNQITISHLKGRLHVHMHDIPGIMKEYMKK